ncbi:MAG: hypothetical protein WD824_09160 [Cyclobacteriaceae bacterium]
MTARGLYKSLRSFVTFLSFEFLLTTCKWPNGGTVIFIRAFGVTLSVMTVYCIVKQGLDPFRGYEFDMAELKIQILNSVEIFGAVFAGIYLALYSRFSSQWGYLSNLYNQIKQTEASASNDEKILNEWKAAFIEDAIALHLALKPMFAMIINTWGHEAKVAEVFEQNITDGKKVLESLLADIKAVLNR